MRNGQRMRGRPRAHMSSSSASIVPRHQTSKKHERRSYNFVEISHVINDESNMQKDERKQALRKGKILRFEHHV